MLEDMVLNEHNGQALIPPRVITKQTLDALLEEYPDLPQKGSSELKKNQDHEYYMANRIRIIERVCKWYHENSARILKSMKVSYAQSQIDQARDCFGISFTGDALEWKGTEQHRQYLQQRLETPEHKEQLQLRQHQRDQHAANAGHDTRQAHRRHLLDQHAANAGHDTRQAHNQHLLDQRAANAGYGSREEHQREMRYNRAHGIDPADVPTPEEIRNAEMPDPTEMRHRRQLVLQRRRAADRLSIAVTQEEAQFRLQIFKFRRWLKAAEGPEGALGGARA